MAKFPPNLDDGELWLPSDIFLNEVPSKYNPYQISFMEDLAGHFAAISLLQNHPPEPAFYSQRLKLAVLDRSANHFPPEFGRRIYGCGNGSSLAPYEPVYEVREQSPEQVQKPGNIYPVDSYLETRNRVLQRQQINRNQNRVCPVQPAGFGISSGGDGFVKESSGTGVFHPRIINPTSAGVQIKRKQCDRSRQQKYHEISRQRNSTRKIGVNKQEECCYHLPPEMGLPQDWTY